MSNLPYALWSIWAYLPILHRLFFLVLSLVSIYALFSATMIMVRLRLISNHRQVEKACSVHRSLAALHVRSANLRQLIGATFYLFGFIFFLTLPLATKTLDSRTPVGWLILENFFIYFAFATNVFFVLLTLHSVQWFVTSRVQATGVNLKAKNVE
jgi:hypothetical protein